MCPGKFMEFVIIVFVIFILPSRAKPLPYIIEAFLYTTLFFITLEWLRERLVRRRRRTSNWGLRWPTESLSLVWLTFLPHSTTLLCTSLTSRDGTCYCSGKGLINATKHNYNITFVSYKFCAKLVPPLSTCLS